MIPSVCSGVCSKDFLGFPLGLSGFVHVSPGWFAFVRVCPRSSGFVRICPEVFPEFVRVCPFFSRVCPGLIVFSQVYSDSLEFDLFRFVWALF